MRTAILIERNYRLSSRRHPLALIQNFHDYNPNTCHYGATGEMGLFIIQRENAIYYNSTVGHSHSLHYFEAAVDESMLILLRKITYFGTNYFGRRISLSRALVVFA